MHLAHALALGPLGVSLLAIGLGAALPPQGQERRPAAPPSVATVRRIDVERDLRLVARIEGTTPAYSWWPLSIDVELVNASPSTSYRIVLPGDGSDAGLREPDVFLSTEILAEDGTWTLMPRHGAVRCGTYDSNWLDEVVRLAPGASRRLQWISKPDLPDHGTVRLRAHYVYTARPARSRSGAEDPAASLGLGAMEGVEPFELVSAPLEFVLAAPETTRAQLERDLALEVTREGSGPAFSWELQHFRARLTNRSTTRALRVVRPTFPWLDGCHQPRVTDFARVDLGSGTLQAASRLAGGFYDGPMDGELQRPREVDWREQVVELLPGQSIECELPPSFALHEVEKARTAALSIEYAYDGRPACGADRLPATAPAAFGAMAAIPPFRLRSNEVAWPVRSPMRIEVVPRADRDPRQATSLSECLRIVLRNDGDEPIEVSSAQRAAKLEVSTSQFTLGERSVDVRGTLAIGPLVLPARGELSLLEDPAVDVRALWTTPRDPRSPPAYEPGRVEALLHRPGWTHAFRAMRTVAAK
ncbi:MAG: hypothetical protein IPJ77_21565 [Planctomycetes bacterium]|nr:hypothetical protein [Planctomycetota bacterium]